MRPPMRGRMRTAMVMSARTPVFLMLLFPIRILASLPAKRRHYTRTPTMRSGFNRGFWEGKAHLSLL
ncbi:hypothetical protein M501DRAFT_995900 [Patellaria atrata CBS 101060]|uniref:Uncharacterized protein n=1 Tax=Patellaria atrata CBS 101060 TaxID=1346257 RepID=A0A9P4S715_9PEZI|nr:hypothetical protein M501DRAFT_995900 [Patellaria atrata CBS 101060]